MGRYEDLIAFQALTSGAFIIGSYFPLMMMDVTTVCQLLMFAKMFDMWIEMDTCLPSSLNPVEGVSGCPPRTYVPHLGL